MCRPRPTALYSTQRVNQWQRFEQALNSEALVLTLRLEYLHSYPP